MAIQTMNAYYALPGDVVEMKVAVLVWSSGGGTIRLPPGYYGLVGQDGRLLTLTQVRENKSGGMIAYGKVVRVSVTILELNLVGITGRTFSCMC